jgi:hypothetical protein
MFNLLIIQARLLGAGAEVVQRFQNQEEGRWFACQYGVIPA